MGGESAGVSRPFWRGGEDEIVDMDDVLGLSRCRVDIRRVPLFSRVDWLELEERFRSGACANSSGSAGLGGMSTSVADPEDSTEPRRMPTVDPSTRLGRRRFIPASCRSSWLERGVLWGDTAACAFCAARLPFTDFHDLRIDLRTLPLRSAGSAGCSCGELFGEGEGDVDADSGGRNDDDAMALAGSAGDGWRDT